MEMRNHTFLLFIFLYILNLSFLKSATAIAITSYEIDKSFFLCLSSAEINYTTQYSPAYYRIFDLAAWNLRCRKSSFKPVAIILPETKEKLAATLICCTKVAPSLSFTIRSGGHSEGGLSYSSPGNLNNPFVMIDLMNLDQVSVDLESKTAWVEGGATIGEIYYALGRSSNHLGFSAGLCPTVGSGGHIGGGGYGLMSRKYGLAADNVVDAILVDANGRLFDRKTMGEDVFWAIRGGGGGSWGVVYSWKIKLLDVPEIVTAFTIRRNGSITKTAELLYKWQMVAPYLDDDFSLMVTSISAESETSSIASLFQGLYLGPKTSALAWISHSYPELDLAASECNEMSWAESMAYFAGDGDEMFTIEDLKDRFGVSNQKLYSKWKGDYVRDRITIKGIENILDMLMEEPKGELGLWPLGGMLARIGSEFTPFPHRKGNHYATRYSVTWGEEDDKGSDVYMDWIDKVYDYMTPFVSKGPRAAYVNMIDLDLGVMDWDNHNISVDEFVELGRVWGEKYFLGNYDRLVRAKTLIDPGNVFRHKQSIPSNNKLFIQDSGDNSMNQFRSFL